MKAPLCTGLVTAAQLIVVSMGVGEPPKSGGQAKDVATVVAGNDVFAFELYSHLAREKGNLFFSPYSISTALAMTYGGARGDTAEAMAKTLHFALPPGELHPAFGNLLRHLNDDDKVRKYQLYVANRLWGQKKVPFQPAFLKLTRDIYAAGLEEVDYQAAPEAARQTINAWVEKQTKDKIKDLIPAGVLDANTRLVLTNAIYFKASWANAFWERTTSKDKFQLNSKETVTVPFMHKRENARYLANDQLQMVSIPYENHQLHMVVLLPRKVDGLKDLEKSLTSARLNEWRKKMNVETVHLMLPKFKFTSSFKMKQVLSEMGMGVAFTNSADFSGMSTREPLKISEVIHKAFVDVHEKGTEAAAATAVVIEKKEASKDPPPVQVFRADRPFVFLIQEARTGSILFAGRVANPLAQ